MSSRCPSPHARQVPRLSLHGIDAEPVDEQHLLSSQVSYLNRLTRTRGMAFSLRYLPVHVWTSTSRNHPPHRSSRPYRLWLRTRARRLAAAPGRRRWWSRPLGHIAWQPPFLPVTFSLDANGTVAVTVNPLRLATLIGTVTVGVGVVKNLATDGPLPAQPADVTQLIICPKGSAMQRCQAYQIGTGRTI